MASTDQPCYISDNGSCITCKVAIDDNEVLQCFSCSKNFHALCKNTGNQICNKSLLTLLLQRSTKKNFVWYCDNCLTRLELNNAESKSSQSEKVEALENKIDLLTEKVNTISNALAPLDNSAPLQINRGQKRTPNVWKNTSKVTILKNNLSGAPNLQQLEQRVVDDGIEVTSSKRTPGGDFIITCPTSSAANKVKALANTLLPDHVVKDPHVKYSWINVVGFETNHSLDDVFKMLVNNNYVFESLKGKTIEHAAEFLEVKLVKPCLKNPNIYRALLKVSNSLRAVIKRGQDKLRIGLYNCQVYDQAPQIRRCNKCQRFGHWVAECNDQNGKACAKCASLSHETRNCPDSSVPKCINCSRAGVANLHPAHTADSPICPCFIEFRNRSYSSGHSNISKHTLAQHQTSQISSMAPNSSYSAQYPAFVNQSSQAVNLIDTSGNFNGYSSHSQSAATNQVNRIPASNFYSSVASAPSYITHGQMSGQGYIPHGQVIGQGPLNA